jgi:hypothetical protein
MQDDPNTSNHEHELARRLDVVAASVSVRPDLAEVERGAGRIRSRRRMATGVVAAMLIAGAGGVGFGIGRSVSDGEQIASNSAAQAPASDAPAGDEPAGDEPAVDEPAADEVDEPVGTVPTEAVPVTTVVTTDGVPESGDDAASSYWAPAPMQLLQERTLASGIRVRLQVGQTWEHGWSEGDWTPAGYCMQNREARVTFDGPDLVDVGGAGLFAELFRGLQVQVGETGWADDHPVRYVVVQAEPSISEVAVNWDDGLSDRAAVTNGVAVLVVEPATVDRDGVWSRGYTIEVTDTAGVRTLTQADLNYYEDPEFRAGCNPPPPALPDAGEQPADPAAAEQALRDRFALLWDMDVARDDKRSLLDDWTGVDAAADAVLTGGFSDEAATAVHEIEEVVFTSPTEAWFRYALLTDISNFYERYGTATLVDDEWQFTRAVMCQDLSLGGGTCEPGFEPIFPPSWYERYHEECWETEDGTICETMEDAG